MGNSQGGGQGGQGGQSIFSIIQAAVTALSNWTQGFPRSGGAITSINNLSTAGFIQIIGPNPARSSITFTNPGVNPIWVTGLTAGSSGGTLNPTPTQLGGTFEVVPGAWVTLNKNVQQGWQAMPLTGGSSQPFTVMDQ